jgi:cell wall-associated NlpC family hydrolase
LTDGRRKHAARALTTLCLTAVSATVLTAAPAGAEPTIPDVKERVGTLEKDTRQLAKRHHASGVRLDVARDRLAIVTSLLEQKQTELETLEDDLTEGVVANFRGESFGTSSAGVPTQLTTVSQFAYEQSQVIDEATADVEDLEEQVESAREQVVSAREKRQDLTAQQRQLETRSAKAEKLLDRLQEERRQMLAERAEREERASRDDDREPVSDVPASGGAAAAVQYALAQVGDAYSYGAAGPDAFDCSGLTMMAWAQAGVSLPHSSGAQMGSGTSVSTSELQPGDLVFYYSPVSHVGIYIGNGQLAHAANPGTGVEVTSVDSMPISGAVRPG